MLTKRLIRQAESIKGFLEFVPEDSSATRNKKLLLEMARNKELRPNKNHPLGRILCSYTCKHHKSYDSNFEKQIRISGPHWFVNTASENKRQLLAMAKRGEPRPIQKKHPLGAVLCNYTSSKSECYDAVFDKQIRKLAPHWFVDTASENKRQLLAMVKRGEPRPIQRKGSLGHVLYGYTSAKSESYDAEFDKEIRKLAPHWFVDTKAENKRQLLAMAKRGEPRPIYKKHPLGSVLFSYTNRNQYGYDAEFDREIRKLAPHWFVDTKAENKRQLLEMAKRGEPRPCKRKNPLGANLSNYTSIKNKCYDAEFDREIRKLAPHWFVDTKAKKKKLLLQMARKGDAKPNKLHPLRNMLSCYTNPKNKCYDLSFDKQIRKLAPHWFGCKTMAV